MTRRHLVLLLAFGALVAGVAPPSAAEAVTPTAAAERLGGGFSVSWFETRSGPARFRARTTDALVRAGLRNIRIRVRADRFRTAVDMRRLARVVTRARSSGLQVVVSWAHPTAQARPTATQRAAYVRWWTTAARALRAQPDTVLLGLLDDPRAARGLGRTSTHRDWTTRALRAIRATGGRNRTRTVVVPAPTADPRALSRITRRDRNVLRSWHRYAAGPSHRRGATQWVGDGRARGRALVDRAVRQAARRRPSYLAAWSPLDRARGTITAAEAARFGRHLRSRLATAGIPWTITRLEDFYDERAQRWRTTARVGGVDLTVGAVLTAATGVEVAASTTTGGTSGPGGTATAPGSSEAGSVPGAAPGLPAALSPGSPPSPGTDPAPAPTAPVPLVVDDLRLAQTHVLPPGGKAWGAPLVESAQRELHFTGGREALALVRFAAATTPTAPRLEGIADGTSLGTLPMRPPSELPRTEAGGPAYGADLHTARVPAAWMRPGLRLRAVADGHTPSSATSPVIGASPAFGVRVLPFYLFGATPQNSGKPLSATGAPTAARRAAMFATWPVAQLDVANHPGGAFVSADLVVRPRDGQPAYVARSTADLKTDGKFAGMGSALEIMGRLRSANGENNQPFQYYAPMIWRDGAGQITGSGGGLGGGSVGAGDDSYAGIFIHEQGHAFGIPHVGDAWTEQRYPYRGGSLDGSAWGFDLDKDVFRPTFVPPTAASYDGCEDDRFHDGEPRVVADGRCVKQDPMQSGSGDQDAGEPYTIFSDYSTAVMQGWFEDGRAERDTTFPSGYRRWNRDTRRYDDAGTSTTSNGLYGFHGNLPVQRGVPVYGIAFTRSNAGTAGATRIYPPLRFTGNLVATIDPTSQADIDLVKPGGPGRWYCEYYGCDITLKVTYASGQVRHVLRNDGFREWFGSDEPQPASATDPTSSDSYRTYAANVPDLGAIARIDVLDTPIGFKQVLSGSPRVLATWTP